VTLPWGFVGLFASAWKLLLVAGAVALWFLRNARSRAWVLSLLRSSRLPSASSRSTPPRWLSKTRLGQLSWTRILLAIILLAAAAFSLTRFVRLP
jgi:hypothetical protein